LRRQLKIFSRQYNKYSKMRAMLQGGSFAGSNIASIAFLM